ncbi:DUF3570 domain-containing protein [Fulvivirga lutea]|uniref:DUF3570 domain-containing protein n=1 Tax=Fulvivirga lutea TaxID=2810512 RepID=A0A975A1U8_9BACT|nr:DUF3570 domain-containing protein [Fulvivirga lutea]QSE98216.1 DUF3570 domain-containing protein [Fulvivirga lutea]
MRMQLKYWLVLVLAGLTSMTSAQETFKELDETEINFLFNYYEQDGDNGAVQGGRGTEELSNVAPSLIVNIPLDTVKNLIAYIGFDNYSSASTDRIDDPYLENINLSTASSSDTRFYTNITYQRKNNAAKVTQSYKAGVSVEYDYTSISAGYGFAKESKDQNRELSLSGMAYFDTWQLIFPTELRGTDGLNNEKQRQSFNFTSTLSQVINKKLQASISGELVYQTGRLSTPFHRVFFNDGESNIFLKERRTEKLPDTRFKIPLGLRLNYYLNDYVVLRGYYRYYYDDFGITANTFEIETPIKIHSTLTIYPFYRYHIQTAADYFKPFGQHELTDEFYTSDYDLSEINTTSLGFGFKYSPIYGLARFKGPFSKKTGKVTKFKSVEVRYADYTREGNNANDPGGGDLDAYSLSFNMTFTF